MRVTFWGVRGSTPCSCETNRRYGGNTACVALEVAGEDPIVLDLGTGLRFFGETQPRDGTFRGSALISHLHWDHIQGLPFFAPVLAAGGRLDVYGPSQGARSLGEAVDELVRPPFFPVRVGQLPGDVTFHDVTDDDFAIGGAKVRVRSVPHAGATNGYRIDWDGISVAYVSDHQSPAGPDGSEGNVVDPAVLELCDGVDLLIHDAQFWPGEWAQKNDWGHCTVDYAVGVARQSGVRRLALFHHDPAHGDDEVDRLLAHARASIADSAVEEVLAASEGLTIAFDR